MAYYTSAHATFLICACMSNDQATAWSADIRCTPCSAPGQRTCRTHTRIVAYAAVMYVIDEAILHIYRKHTDWVAARNLPWETPIPLTKAAEIQRSVALVSARNLTPCCCSCLPWAFSCKQIMYNGIKIWCTGSTDICNSRLCRFSNASWSMLQWQNTTDWS